MLAKGPANYRQMGQRTASDAMTVLPLLRILENKGLVYRVQDDFHLGADAASISIAAIVRAVDGDIPRTKSADEFFGLAQIECWIAGALAAVLDNMSLAEAADSRLDGDLPDSRFAFL